LLATLQHLKKIEFCGIEMIDDDAFVPNLEVYKIKKGKLHQIINSFPNRINDMRKLYEYDIDNCGELGLVQFKNATIKKNFL